MPTDSKVSVSDQYSTLLCAVVCAVCTWLWQPCVLQWAVRKLLGWDEVDKSGSVDTNQLNAPDRKIGRLSQLLPNRKWILRKYEKQKSKITSC